MVIEILLSTYNEGIAKVPNVLLSPRNNVKWLISFQYSEDIFIKQIPPSLYLRDDVTLIPFEGKGLSQNRNMALAHATGDILLLADDDATFKQEYFDNIFQTYLEDNTVDIVCFQALTHDGKELHPYPNYSFFYQNTPRGYWYNSQEITFRRTSQVPQFDTRFVINAPKLGCGEEEVFLWHAHKKGLTIRYIPKVIVETDANTSRQSFFTDKRLQRAKGGVLCIMHGPLGAFLRCLKYAIRHANHNPILLLWQMVYGIIYIRR